MKVKINVEMQHSYAFDADKESVLLVFDNDEEVRAHIRNLQNMVDNFPAPGEKRGYLVYPDGTLSAEQIDTITNFHIKTNRS